MKLVCAWCNRVIREGTEPVSHGICPACAAKIPKATLKKNSGGYYDDRALGGAIFLFVIIAAWFMLALCSEGLHYVSKGKIPNWVPLKVPDFIEKATPALPPKKHSQGHRRWD